MKIMNHLFVATVLCGAAVCSNAAGFGVIDLEKVVDSSTYLKQQNASLELTVKPQSQKLEQLAKEIEGLQKSSNEKNANVEQLGKQYQAKVNEYQSLQQTVQSRVQSTIQATNTEFESRLKKVAEQVRQENNLDFVLNKNAALAFDPKSDLTDKMIQKVNAIK